MKIWIILSFKGFVRGVYFEEHMARERAGPNDLVDRWEIELTPAFAKIIKDLAKEL